MLQTKSIEFQLQDLRFVGKWDSPWFTCIHYRFNKHRPLSSYQIGYLDGPFLDTALPWASRTACSAKHSLMKSLGSLGDSFASKDGFERASSRGFLKWNHNLRTKNIKNSGSFPRLPGIYWIYWSTHVTRSLVPDWHRKSRGFDTLQLLSYHSSHCATQASWCATSQGCHRLTIDLWLMSMENTQ